MNEIEPRIPTFTAHYDDNGELESIEVDALPPCIMVDDYFLHTEERRVIESLRLQPDGTLRIEVSNAACTYRLLREEPLFHRSVWLAVSG